MSFYEAERKVKTYAQSNMNGAARKLVMVALVVITLFRVCRCRKRDIMT